ncbi:glycosyltransferase family 39 protein [Solirubrobacter sp. CPCC 204708]|nr:glycosyltransferase family 39 protein [Solirubrobacter deserti]
MSTLALDQPRRRAGSLSALRALVQRPELLVLLALAGGLNLWALDLNGYANDYYAAAVRSMTQSWHAFLYGSFDAAGLQTVDKPPLALWVQALSARVFGFNSWALLVPQALMGVATVGLTYDLARSRFGRAAGFVAGLTLALTPITVAMARHNNPDALLVLCLVAAVWALDRGLRREGSLKWLVLSGVFVGLGFETKMAAALLVVPGLALAWFCVAPKGRVTAAKQLLVGGAAMAVVGLAWPMLLWLTPASERPYVSGTDDNSIWSLILGYNGLGRLFGQDGGPGGGGGGVFGGEAGPARLLNAALGGQAGWLIGFALVAALGLLLTSRLRRDDARTGYLIAVGGAFAVTAVAFSRASGIFHPYYVAALAPFTALLVGAGWSLLRSRTWGPLLIAGGLATEIVVIADSATDLSWATGVLLVLGAVAAAVIVFAPKLRAIAAAAAVGLLLFAPASWAVRTLGHATSSTFPAGGPASQGMGGGRGGLPGGNGQGGPGGGGFAPGMGGAAPGASGSSGTNSGGAAAPGPGGGGGMFGGDTSALTEAVAYANANGGGTVVVSSQSGAAQSIVESGADVAAIGGFSGRETVVTAEWLADAVEDGRIRWIIASSDSGGMRDGRTGASHAMTIATQVGKATTIDGLYDLQGTADEIRTAA